MTDPWELNATEAVRLIAEGTLSPVELTQSCLDRRDQVDPALNAMVTRDDGAALKSASYAAYRVSSGEPLGPLHGIPVAIKDFQPAAGLPTTYGSLNYADNIAESDSPIVAKIRAAGATIIGKTNIPEFSIGANTINPLFGATGNPYNPELTCGGSSGGSAVAVASGMTPLATGSDHGGSLRIPASFCGVVGFRATPGVVPHELRTITQTFYSVQGPMARNVADTALLLSVIAQRTSRLDPMAFPLDASALASIDPIDLSEVRVGLSTDLGGLLVSKEISDTFAERSKVLASLVGSCDEAPVKLAAASDIDWRIRSDVFATQFHREAEQWGPDFNPNLVASYEKALNTDLLDVAKGRRAQMDLYQEFQAHFDQFDVLVCPGVSVSPFPWSDLYPQSIDGKPVENYMAWLGLTAAITVVGHPVVSIPFGFDSQGMPFGIQIIGPAYSDQRLLSIAASIESALRGHPAIRGPGLSDRTGGLPPFPGLHSD